MTPLTRQGLISSSFSRSYGGRLHSITSDTNANSDTIRTRGGHILVTGKLSPPQTAESQKLTKVLLKVNIQNSVGPVSVVMSPENTVQDLIKLVIEIYAKDQRRPLLNETDPQCFNLHYSPFNLERLKPEEKLINLGSRNFFLCPKHSNGAPMK